MADMVYKFLELTLTGKLQSTPLREFHSEPENHQLAASEMLCKEGRHDFDLEAERFADPCFCECLSRLIS